MKRLSIAEQTLAKQIHNLESEIECEKQALERVKAMINTKETIISAMYCEIARLREVRLAASERVNP